MEATHLNGSSRVLKPSLKATDVSPIDLGVDRQNFLREALGDAKSPNISRN
jgi:hypothetical protein